MYTIQLQSLINQFACDRAFEWIRKQNFKSIKRALRLQPYDIVKDDKEAILENIYSKSGMPLGTFTSCKKLSTIHFARFGSPGINTTLAISPFKASLCGVGIILSSYMIIA